ncbi:MAG: transglutaminase family protein, partial [Caulobacteraceae bacterium]
MLLDIRHVTRYHYERPVRESLMELRMQPQKSIRQRLISFDLELDPRAQLFSYIDPFGNAVHHFDVPQPHDELTIVARSTVETQPPPELPDHLDLGEWDRLKSSFTQAECFEFLHEHGFTQMTPALRAFMQDKALEAEQLHDPLSRLRFLNKTIYEAFAYEPGVTRADSVVDEALKRGAGVCQDFAHIMITVARNWGLPARYVSGYLFNDRRSGDRSDPDATHAWVEVFLPSQRWVGFDPTNNMLTGERHVGVAIGRDYGDIPP